MLAGPQGLQYLTIRSRWDPGLRLLPDCKDERPPAGTYKSRQHTSAPESVLDASVLTTLPGPLLRPVMHEAEGNARAWMLALPPDGNGHLPADDDTDRVLVVCSGSLTRTLANDAMSCHYIERGEAVTLTASDQGADILVLQFPNRD